MKRRLFFVYVLPVLGWMTVMFSLSTRVGTAAHTDAALNALLARFFPHWFHRLTASNLDALHYYPRKAAHLTEYAILGALLVRALCAGRPTVQMRVYPFAWLLAALFAASDEYHQTFVPGRTPKVTDVLLDSAGAAVGLTAYCFARGRRAARGRTHSPMPQETP